MNKFIQNILGSCPNLISNGVFIVKTWLFSFNISMLRYLPAFFLKIPLYKLCLERSLLITIIIALSASANATEKVAHDHITPENPNSANSYQKIIEEYKKHLAEVPAATRKEIQNFRVEIAKIQKQKRELYKKLSVSAQEYLQIEEKYRKKLPVGKDGELDLQQKQTVNAEQTNK